MSKILSIIMGLMLFVSPSSYAMQMSQPVKLGRIVHSLVNGKLEFTGATKSKAKYAVFGSGKDALYVYGAEKGPTVYVGGGEKRNTIRVGSLGLDIFKIDTDSGITIYAMRHAYDLGCEYSVIGKSKSGEFVKYFDTDDVFKRYYGKPGAHKIYNSGMDLIVDKDSIFIDICEFDSRAKGITYPGKKIARFQFKWDDQKQWFGVNKI